MRFLLLLFFSVSVYADTFFDDYYAATPTPHVVNLTTAGASISWADGPDAVEIWKNGSHLVTALTSPFFDSDGVDGDSYQIQPIADRGHRHIGDLSPSVVAGGTTVNDTRVSSLLAERFGYGAAATGGTVLTEVTDLADLAGYLQDGVSRWIYYSPSLDGQTWQVPFDPNAGGALNIFEIAANKTIDGRDAHVIWQLGTPDTVTSYSNPAVYRPVRITFNDGNVIMSNVHMRGDLAAGVVEDAGITLNGTSDMEIHGGRNYFFDQLTLERFSDEALSVFHNNGGSPDMITWSRILFNENKNDSIVGAPHPTSGPFTSGPLQNPAHITIAYNKSVNPVEGRAPGIFYNVIAHVVNVWAEGYLRQGVQAWDNSEVRLEYSHLAPSCTGGVGGTLRAGGLHLYDGSTATRPLLGAPGVLRDTGSFVVPCAGGSSDSNFNGTLSATVPYTYQVVTTQAELQTIADQAGAHQ